LKNYPKSKKYDPHWIIENAMGPHPLWLLEELCEHLELRPGMKVLDMGCGKGITSIFLAKEFGVTVFANDLWISATENLRRFEEAGVADRVFPIHAEAHALPYANGFFDMAISIDSYHYYGTDETYFPCVYEKLVKSGGQFGIVCPGYTKEFEKGHPEGILKFIANQREKEAGWGEDMFTFHSAEWWRRHWEKTGLVEITACYDIPDVKLIWDSWAKGAASSDDEFLKADTEDEVALIAMTAVKRKCDDE